MCTSFKYKNCMGRNFDYEISYKEEPRKYTQEKYNIYGMVAGIVEDYPLYYDAMNEEGLCIAGLNFTNNAYYYEDETVSKNNIAPWELPIKLLGNCKNIDEAKEYMKTVKIINKPFNQSMPNSPLHWFVCDRNSSIVIEQTKENGLQIYDNKCDVLTNNPPFDKQSKHCDFKPKWLGKILKKLLPSKFETRGTETYSVPGDLTSMGRFERVVFFKEKMSESKDLFNPVTQTFHLLDIAKQLYGATPVNDKFEYTIYSVVYDMNKQLMYVKTYVTNRPIIYDCKV